MCLQLIGAWGLGVRARLGASKLPSAGTGRLASFNKSASRSSERRNSSSTATAATASLFSHHVCNVRSKCFKAPHLATKATPKLHEAQVRVHSAFGGK